jgi:phage N-6-adenine-methyltransferase
LKGNGLASHFSSNTEMWETPQWLFDELNEEFDFDLDVCATAENAKCKRYFSPEEDGLSQEWRGKCWCNPPYGKTISRWLSKAVASCQEGALVVCLVPSRTDTAWWHHYVMKASEIRFFRGRLVFRETGDRPAQSTAPFASAVVVFRAAE